MKKILLILFLMFVPVWGSANQLLIGNCRLQVPDTYEVRTDGTYYQKVDYDKFEYSTKDISSGNLRSDDSFLKGKNIAVYNENDLFVFDYLLSAEGIDIELNSVTTVDARGQTTTFSGFTLDEFNALIKSCNYQFSPSSLDEFFEIHKMPD